MARKKKSEIVESADVAEMVKTVPSVWPKVVVGNHLTVTTYEDGKTDLVWDDNALMEEVRAAIASVENVPVKKTRKTKKT